LQFLKENIKNATKESKMHCFSQTKIQNGQPHQIIQASWKKVALKMGRRKGHLNCYRSEIGKVRVVVVAVVVVVVVVVVGKNRQKKAIFQTAFFLFFLQSVFFLDN